MRTTHPEFQPTQKRFGFSLIELLIVIAIVAILSQIAVPSYTKFITKIRRGDALHLLEKNAILLERCLTIRGAYDNDCALYATSENGYYTLNPTVSELTYTLTATPVSGGKQANDSGCTTFSINDSGHRTATGDESDRCW